MPNIPFGLGNGTQLLNAGQSGATSLMDALRSGIETYQKNEEAKNTPKRLSEALLGQQITNKMNQQKADYEPMRQQLEQHLTQARIQKALRGPEPTYNNLEKAMQGAQRITQQYGADSQEAKLAQTYVQRLAQGSQGLQLTTDPATGALTSLSFGGSSRGGPQSALVNDENGNPTMVSKPTTAQASAQQKTSLSEIGRSTIAKKAEMPYVGSGSNQQILEDRFNYSKKGDKEAGKRLVQAAVAKMIAPEYAGFQLASQGVAATIPALNHQFETIKQGWPATANLVVENLPQELQKQAKEEHAKLLAEIKSAKEQHAAKGYPVKLEGNKKRLKYNTSTGRLE